MKQTGAGRAEGGFTLIEVVVAVSLMTLVMAALSGAVIALLRLTPTPGSTFSDSHDAQLAATYWPADVQSADDVSTTDASCRAAAGPTTPLVRFLWTTLDGVTKLAAYQHRPGPGPSPKEDLVRTFCVRTGSGPAAPQSTTVIARGVQPVVACDTQSCAAPVATSRLTVTEATGFSFTVGGTRRVGR